MEMTLIILIEFMLGAASLVFGILIWTEVREIRRFLEKHSNPLK